MKVFIFILLVSSCSAICKGADTLFFKSQFERKQFESLKTNKIDIISLLISFDSDSSYSEYVKKRLDGFYYYIKSKNLEKKPEKIFAREIFKEAHAFFLKKYEEHISFSRIFKNGYYNCVSATALFAIILENYNIPYYIKETPTHVYLVAFPNSHNILFETTSPQGFFAPDTKMKETYVNWMIRAKFTTQEYVDKLGYPTAFQELYYPRDNIDLTEIAGIQYYNETVNVSQETNYVEAIRNILKACVLHPSKRNDFFKVNLIETHLNSSKFETIEDITYIITLGNSVRDEVAKKDVVGIFKNVIKEQLFENSNDTIFKQSYRLLEKGIRDSTLLSEITLQYNIGLAGWSAVKGKLDDAIKYGRLAYQKNIKNTAIQEIIWRSIVSRMSTTVGNTKEIEILNNYQNEFPFLKDNNYFRSLLALNYAYTGYRQFLADNPEEGYKLMHLLELEIQDKGVDSMVNESQVALLYAEAGAYHFRMKDYKKAREIILKGFTYAPEDSELKERLKITEEEIKKN